MPQTPSWLAATVTLLDERCPLPLHEPFSSRDAQALGVSRKLLRAAVDRHLVREVVRGAYAVAQLPDSIELRAGALGLVVSDGAVVTDRTAAWLHEVDVLPRRAVHEPVPLDVFSASDSRVRRPGVASGIREFRDRDLTLINGVLVSAGLRTALDLGRLLPRYDAIGALDAFLRWGVPRHELEWGVHRFKGHRGVVQLRELVAVADPRAQSMPESALRLHAVDADLPPLTPQVWVGGRYCVDIGLPELRYAAEYHGVAFHTGEEREEKDGSRLAWLTDERWTVDEFWKDGVYGPHANPAAVMRAGLQRARAQMGAWRPQGRFLG